MRLEIKNLAAIKDRLARIRPDEIMGQRLEEQAQRIVEGVQTGLSEPVGAGDHDKPWARTGALHDSIAVTTNGLEAAVGSNDPAAAPQEMGTTRIPPRPFLAPVASSMGEEVARNIGSAVADALRGESANES